MSDVRRPDPDALLRSAAREGRGCLKIFLGAAPGVGKTFEMLTEAASLRAEGVDVVIAVVETHGRAETEALTRGFETVPRRTVTYEGRTLDEMDLDAVLARAPRLALVDELAHTNAPGSRHPKRWQDVEELLAAGIDVCSTLNVQHVESLNDVVAGFTRVRVRETVPDAVLEQAELEVVDIPPDELIARLKAGKVYLPHEATRALSHFFSANNLSALRELALRRAAQAVDARMLDQVRASGVGGNWAGSERVVVAVSELPGADALVRAAKRTADALHVPWTCLSIETPRSARFDDAQNRRLAATMTLATQLGAAVATVPAPNVFDGIAAFLGDARATQLVVGKSRRSRLFELRHGSVVDRLVRETPGVTVHVVPVDGTDTTPARRRAPTAWGLPLGYAVSTAMVGAVTTAATALFHVLALGNVALLYLLPVMAAASLYGLRTGLFAALLSSLAYNFFFLPPTWTLTVADPENVVSIFVLLGVAVATSQLAARVRAQADIAAASARTNATLAGFVRELSGVRDRAEAGLILCGSLARLFDAEAILLVRSDGDLAMEAAASKGEPRLDTMDMAAARWAMDHGSRTGKGSGTLAASEWMFLPLDGGSGVLAVLGLARTDADLPVRADRLPLLTSLADQSALVLERLRLQDEVRGIEAMVTRDRLRQALLSSVGHDLRTPLTAVMAAADQLDERTDPGLAATIRQEAARLKRFVDNLLGMARVEAGALNVRAEPIDLADAVGQAARDARGSLDGRALRIEVSPDLPLVLADPQLLHHVLLNLLDNVGHYADAGTDVLVQGDSSESTVTLAVIDTGPGLPGGRERDVFDTFRRLDGNDRKAEGTGLGLALVKAFADAMGIEVRAENRRDGTPGAVFVLTFAAGLVVADVDGGLV